MDEKRDRRPHALHSPDGRRGLNRFPLLGLALVAFAVFYGWVWAGAPARANISPAATSTPIDVDLPSTSTGSTEGTLALRIFAPATSADARYAEGAPVVVYVPGGTGAGALRPQLEQAADMIRIVFLFPGGTDLTTGRSSDGTYDDRGAASIVALRDVIRYAAGDLADAAGKRIDDVAPAPVLHDNIGLLGASNGGNIVVAVAALHGTELANRLRYVIQWESPVSSQIATADVGGVRLACSGGQAQHVLYVNPRYRGYGSPALDLDYSQLTYNPSNPIHSVFWDGNGDGRYTTVLDPDTGCRTPDLDLDGTLESNEDFPLRTEGTGQAYSRQATQALTDQDTFGGNWPSGIATLSEANAHWDLREAVRFYPDARANIPNLEGMVLTSAVDHVQSAPDHPHIRQAFEGWDQAGAWVKINPAREYALEVDPSLSSRTDLPDNGANTAPTDWTDTSGYAYPDGLEEVYWAAAVHEMADRARGATSTPTFTPTPTTTPTATPTATPTGKAISMAFGFYNELNALRNATPADEAELESILRANADRMKAAGATLSRIHPRDGYISFAWNRIDPDLDGTPDFSRTDVLIRVAAEKGVRLLPVLSPDDDFANDESYPPQTIQETAAYTAYVQAVVERYDGDDEFGPSPPDPDTQAAIQAWPIHRWQMDNEPDLRWSLRNDDFETPEEYVAVTALTRAALQTADPDARLVFGGLALSHGEQSLDYLDQVIVAAGEFPFDEMGVHWYPPDPVLQSWATTLDAVRQRIGPDVPLLITEFGVPSQPTSSYSDQHASERTQASLLAGTFALLAARGGALSLWNSIRDNALESSPFAYQGLESLQGTRKLSWYTYRRMSELLGSGAPATYTPLALTPPLYGVGVGSTTNADSMIVLAYDYATSGDYDPGSSGALPAPITATLTGLSGASVRVESAVPAQASGAEVGENPDWAVRDISVSEGKAEIPVGVEPVYVFVSSTPSPGDGCAAAVVDIMATMATASELPCHVYLPRVISN